MWKPCVKNVILDCGIQTQVDDAAADSALRGRLGAHGYGGSGIFGAGSALDALHQALAAVHLDLVSAIVRVELDLGKIDARRDHARRTRARKRDHVRPGGGDEAPGPATAWAATPACAHAEARILAELRRHHAGRAVARTRMAADRPPHSTERESCLTEAIALLRAAAAREQDHLGLVATWDDVQFDVPAGPSAPVTAAPPPPALLSRTTTTITLQPRAWHGPENVDHLRCFGKASGAGTDVSLTNADFMGTGCPIAYRDGKATAATIRGLCPNESYVFAVAAFDTRGDVVGAIGEVLCVRKYTREICDVSSPSTET